MKSGTKPRMTGWNPFKRNQKRQPLLDDQPLFEHQHRDLTKAKSGETKMSVFSVSSVDHDQGFCDANENVIDIPPSSSDCDVESPTDRSIGLSDSSVESPFASAVDIDLENSTFSEPTFEQDRDGFGHEVIFDQTLKIKDPNAKFDDFDSFNFHAPFPRSMTNLKDNPQKKNLSPQRNLNAEAGHFRAKENGFPDLFGENVNTDFQSQDLFPENHFPDYKSPINISDKNVFFSNDEQNDGPKEVIFPYQETETEQFNVEKELYDDTGAPVCNNHGVTVPSSQNDPKHDNGEIQDCHYVTFHVEDSETKEENPNQKKDEEHNDNISLNLENMEKQAHLSLHNAKARLGKPFRSRLKKALATKASYKVNRFVSPSKPTAKQHMEKSSGSKDDLLSDSEGKSALSTTPRSKELWAKNATPRSIKADTPDEYWDEMENLPYAEKAHREKEGQNKAELEPEGFADVKQEVGTGLDINQCSSLPLTNDVSVRSVTLSCSEDVSDFFNTKQSEATDNERPYPLEEKEEECVGIIDNDMTIQAGYEQDNERQIDGTPEVIVTQNRACTHNQLAQTVSEAVSETQTFESSMLQMDDILQPSVSDKSCFKYLDVSFEAQETEILPAENAKLNFASELVEKTKTVKRTEEATNEAAASPEKSKLADTNIDTEVLRNLSAVDSETVDNEDEESERLPESEMQEQLLLPTTKKGSHNFLKRASAIQLINEESQSSGVEMSFDKTCTAVSREANGMGQVELESTEIQPPPPPPPPPQQQTKIPDLNRNASGLVKVTASGKTTASNVIYWSGGKDDLEVVAVAPSRRLAAEGQMWVDGGVSQSQDDVTASGRTPKASRQEMENKIKTEGEKHLPNLKSQSSKGTSTAVETDKIAETIKARKSPRTRDILAMLGQPGVSTKQPQIGDTIVSDLFMNTACSTLSESSSEEDEEDDETSSSSSSYSASSIASDSAILSIAPSEINPDGTFQSAPTLLGSGSATFGGSVSNGSSSLPVMSSSSSEDDIFDSIDDDSKSGKTSFLRSTTSRRSSLACTPSCHTTANSSQDTGFSSRENIVMERSVSMSSSRESYSSGSHSEYDNVEHHVQMAQEWLLKVRTAFLGKSEDEDDDSATMDGVFEPSTVQCEYAGVLGRLKIDINKNKNK